MQFYEEKSKVYPHFTTIFWMNLVEVIMFICLIVSLFLINKGSHWYWFLITSMGSFLLLYVFSLILCLMIKNQLFILEDEKNIKRYKLFMLIPIVNFYNCWLIFQFQKNFKKEVKEIEKNS
jgi:amino acid transporter